MDIDRDAIAVGDVEDRDAMRRRVVKQLRGPELADSVDRLAAGAIGVPRPLVVTPTRLL